MFNAGNETVSQTIRRLLDGGYNQVAGRVLESVAKSVNADGSIMQKRLAELEAEALRLEALGKRMRPDNAVLRALTADLEAVMRRNAGRVDGVSDDLVRSAVDVAGAVTRQLALPNFDPVALRQAGITWNQPDGEAVAQLVSFVDSPAWGEELARLGASVPETVRNQVISGFAQGFTPQRLSRLIRETVQTLPRYEADRLMRTTQLQAYRTAGAIHQNANVGIISRVIRLAALDTRTCLACVSLSGTVIWDQARDAGQPIPRVDDHHFGRCTSVTEVAGIERNIPLGEDWFNGLSEERQRAQMGHANYEAWQNGAVQLRDFVGKRDDPVFGEMVVQNSLKGILGEEAQRYYKSNSVSPHNFNVKTPSFNYLSSRSIRQTKQTSINDQMTDRWYKTLNDNQRAALDSWGGLGYKAYRALAQGQTVDDDYLVELYPSFQSALNTAPNYSGTTWRGVQIDADPQDVISRYRRQIGTVIEFNAPSSSSANPTEGYGFSRGDATGIVFEIYSNKGKNVNQAMRYHGTDRDEYEVIFQKGSRFKVRDVFISQFETPFGERNAIIVQLEDS